MNIFTDTEVSEPDHDGTSSVKRKIIANLEDLACDIEGQYGRQVINNLIESVREQYQYY